MDNPTIISAVISILITLLINAMVYVFAVGQYKNKVDDLVEYKKDSTNEIKDIRDRLSRLEGGVDRDRAHSDYIESNSPLKLTEKGKALLLDSGGKGILDSQMDDLVKAVEKHNPKSAYDVQEFSKKVLKEKQNEEWFIPLKEFIYAEGLSLSTLIGVLGIYLRDEVLAKKGWDVMDIDKDTPSA